jgi:hypothetical protein
VTQWSKTQAWQWYDALPWLCGFNYLPRTAVNWIEMWQKETFDLPTIEQGLGWAGEIGFNTLRIVLPFIVWQDERDGLWRRLDSFLDVAQKNGLSAMICPLDDCEFSGIHPYLGPQNSPTPGVHNSQAGGSPGRNVVMDKSKWPEVEDYVRDIVSTYRADSRIVVWDVYNEPGSSVIFKADGEYAFTTEIEQYSHELMLNVLELARAIDPVQPLTIGGWRISWGDEDGELQDHFIDTKAFEVSDIITFHAYCSLKRMKQVIQQLETYERPILCTEWMGRLANSRIQNQLPLFHKEKIGCYQWGLVKGKTQTHLPWPGILAGLPDYSADTDEWFHDLLHPDGEPYLKEEIDLISTLINTEP